ncbi:hypothetical protein [Candidatus Nitrotoga arctica]|uniref:Uncharacterized protein n=1 Tax=Candidatus Nitrotoga arctica TaxID=453162 RepID=A0ABM8YWG5_9PROT|nr:hypothetical protein [Candidatus Nitrotoga arctica]CAG9931840.1 conserved protein of unknown function [Candidatus Nitrotoga arctica]
MSSFLNRLAAQAMGSANTLRSAVRTPYAAPLSPANRVVPDRQDPTLNTAGNGRQHRGNSGAEWDPESSQEEQVNIYREVSIQPRDNEVTPSSPGSSPEEFVVQSDTGLYTKPDRLRGRSSSAKAMRQSNLEKTVAGEPPVLVDGIEMRIPGNNSTTLPDSNYPSPLLPLKNAARPSALNASAAASSVAAKQGEHSGTGRQGQVDQITEVHVSIGRIEVTAVHESPPPKRQGPTPAKPLSLDEYLARRGRGA